jgi:EmrB/QacA subfamily drug resistance transporter
METAYADETTTATSSPDTSMRRGLVLFAASAASFLVALDLLVVTTALDSIRADLAVSASALQWTVTAYSVSFAALIMTGAALGDRFGLRRMFAIGLGVFALGAAVSAVAGSVEVLVLGRVVQGIGGAIVVPLGLTAVTSAFPVDRRASAIGVLEGVSGLAVLSGPIVGGVVTEYLTWEWIFWLNVPIALAFIPLVLVAVEERYGPDSKLDVPGLVLISVGATGLVWGLVRGNEAGWASAEVAMALIIGTIVTAAFFMWERRAPQPMLPTSFFRSRSFSAGAAAAFLLFAALYGSVFFMAQFMQTTFDAGPFGSGLRLMPWTGTLFLTAPLAGAVADRIGHRRVLVSGLALQALGVGWLAAIADPGMSYLAMVPALIVAGIGTSAALPVSQAAIVSAVSEENVGKAAGANNMVQELGGAAGVAIGVLAFGAAGAVGSVVEFVDGFSGAMAASAGLAFAGILAALVLPRRSATGSQHTAVDAAWAGAQ